MASKKTVKKSAAVPAKVAPKVAAPLQEAKLPSPSRGPLALEWNARLDGSAEVVVVYEGALAAKNTVLARAGTRRSGGAPWADTQDVHMTRAAPNRWVGAIPVRAGAPVEAVELAFHADDEWDNGGRAPLGYYEWSVREQQLVVR
jgi:hypothetical protein